MAMTESRKPAFAKNVTRAATGGIAVVIAAILLMFLQGGFGDGDGDSESDGGDDNLMVSADPGDDSRNEAGSGKDDDEDSGNDGGLTEEQQKALEDGVLEILIDEVEYFLVLPGEEPIYRPSVIGDLVKLAEHAKGDSNGIRVRILRRETSRTKAEVDLKQALSDAGIGDDAVYMPAELLPPR
jgi:hypothetical protein